MPKVAHGAEHRGQTPHGLHKTISQLWETFSVLAEIFRRLPMSSARSAQLIQTSAARRSDNVTRIPVSPRRWNAAGISRLRRGLLYQQRIDIADGRRRICPSAVTGGQLFSRLPTRRRRSQHRLSLQTGWSTMEQCIVIHARPARRNVLRRAALPRRTCRPFARRQPRAAPSPVAAALLTAPACLA